MLRQLGLLLMLVASIDSTTYHDCQLQYGVFRERLMTLRSTCPSPVYHTCCGIKNTFHFAPSGVYELNHPCSGSKDAGQSKVFGYCNMETDDGGWVVIQRRTNGSTPFNRTSKEYEDGFGNLDGEFWFGLRNIYCLTTISYHNVIRLDFTYENGTTGFAVFKNFRTNPKESGYHAAEPSVIRASPYAENFKAPSYRYNHGRNVRNFNTQWTYNVANGGWWDSSGRGHPNGPGNSGNATAYAQWNGEFTPQIEVKIRPLTCPFTYYQSCLPLSGKL